MPLSKPAKEIIDQMEECYEAHLSRNRRRLQQAGQELRSLLALNGITPEEFWLAFKEVQEITAISDK